MDCCAIISIELLDDRRFTDSVVVSLYLAVSLRMIRGGSDMPDTYQPQVFAEPPGKIASPLLERSTVPSSTYINDLRGGFRIRASIPAIIHKMAAREKAMV